MSSPLNTRDAVIHAEKELAAAHLDLDLGLIDRLLHPDYVIVQPDGHKEIKADVLASYGSGKRHWDKAEADELVINLYGDTAVVFGRWQASGRNDTEAFDYAARFISVWFLHEGRWQNVAYQSVEIKNG
jgi:ketosteroid isomerase-like protein